MGISPFLKLIKSLPIYGIKVNKLVFLDKIVKRLNNLTVVFNKILIEAIEI